MNAKFLNNPGIHLIPYRNKLQQKLISMLPFFVDPFALSRHVAYCKRNILTQLQLAILMTKSPKHDPL